MTSDLPCRHEYIKIYQRKLKGLDRRLVSTRAYLPTGFKTADFGHLGEGSFCFCTNCRARLHPKRTAGERLAARTALNSAKALAEAELLSLEQLGEPEISHVISVEELELENVDVQDIEAEGVKLADDGLCHLPEEE